MNSEGITRVKDAEQQSDRLVESNQATQGKEKIIFKMRIG